MDSRLFVRYIHNACKLLKEQTRLIETSQGLHEICYVCYLMMIATFNIFLTLSTIFRNELPNKLGLIFNVVHFFAGMIRIFMKGYYAENITKQVTPIQFTFTMSIFFLTYKLLYKKEKILVDSLFAWQISFGISEVNILTNSIVWNPTKIVYGSVTTKEKRLMFLVICLSICSS